MPQAALPDINTILITYRREVVVDLKSKRYSGVIGSLLSMNAVLPKEYQVEISTPKYNEAINKNILAVCKSCKEETEYVNVRTHDILLDSISSLIQNKKYDKMWKCPKCKKYNSLLKTEFVKPEPKKPYFLKIVPDVPERMDGIISTMAYHKKFEAWARNFLVELEFQMGKYRIEYKPKGDDEFDDNVHSGGEEFDV